MNLSRRATQYLKTLKRDPEWTCDHEKVTKYLLGQGIPEAAYLAKFQVHYSGLELTIKGKRGHGFHAWLFSKEQIEKNLPLDFIEAGNQKLLLIFT